MSKLLPIIGVVTGTAIIGGTGAYLISTQQTTKIKEQFNHSLISSDEAGDAIFKEKLAKFKVSGSINPNNSKLKNAKSRATASSAANNDGLNELKQGCQEIYESNFTDKNAEVFKDFENYCSKNIKDQITTAKWAPSDSGFAWGDKIAKIKEPNKVLVDSLKTILNKQGGVQNNDLKGWCESIQNSLFQGSEDITFQNANEFCTKP